jgi:Uma2 family endonuclease
MTLAEPTTRRWTRGEYYRLADEGWFAGQRVQLIDGEIIQMAPQGYPHANALMLMKRALSGIFDQDCIRPQMPLNVPGESDPEPDFAVTEQRFDQFHGHPTTAVLVIEIADSSIRLDRRKAGLYAKAGVADYWIVNTNSRKLEVFRQPIADAREEFGHRYAEKFDLDETGVIAPLAAPDAKISVKELF